MKRKLLLLNLALAVLTATAFWQLRLRWIEGQAQEQRLMRPPAKTASSPVPAPPSPAQPASGAAYSEIATKMLFSQDRNPNVVLEVAPPKPVPPFPVAYGVMDLGSGPNVIMSATAGAPSRSYSLGQKVGEFTLRAYERDELVFEWDGQQFRKKLQELAPKSGTEPASASAGAGAAAAGAPAVAAQSVAVAPAAAGPGAQVSGDTKECVAGDTTPAGTVKDGYKKIVSPTPFGNACWWERVK
jgi:hypothetical protein